MKCPHCQVQFHDAVQVIEIGIDRDGYWDIEKRHCPACDRLVLNLVSSGVGKLNNIVYRNKERLRYLARPKVTSRQPPPKEVPDDFASDYIEASVVLSDSPKASAALSRRCLQHLIREKAGVKKQDLSKEIDALIASASLPSHLSEALDAVRNIGNFAAHPIKATATGEVLPVEPGEAEWTLDVLDGLFDFYFVQPAILKARRDALNAKLASANKPELK